MNPPTWAGIIAAGAGSRLKAAHPSTPKPLISVGGKPLAHWVVAALREAGIRSFVILLNSSGDAVREYLEKNFSDLAWTFLREDTPSSWESFRLVSRRLTKETDKFLVSTVDALIRPDDVSKFLREAFVPWRGRNEPDASLALTRFVDDEKPLWAEMDAKGKIVALGAKASKSAVTCGLYALRTDTVLGRLGDTHARLREFWTDLVDSGAAVRGVLLGQTVDVDRPQDLHAAEKVTLCFDA